MGGSSCEGMGVFARIECCLLAQHVMNVQSYRALQSCWEVQEAQSLSMKDLHARLWNDRFNESSTAI